MILIYLINHQFVLFYCVSYFFLSVLYIYMSYHIVSLISFCIAHLYLNEHLLMSDMWIFILTYLLTYL